MKNAFARMGSKCASLLAGGVLLAGITFAAQINEITVTLPHAVTVGSTVLPVGQYTINSFEMGGEQVFVFRGEHISPVTLISERVDGSDDKTELLLTKDGDQWHFDKLLVAGSGTAFGFLSGK